MVNMLVCGGLVTIAMTPSSNPMSQYVDAFSWGIAVINGLIALKKD